MLVLYDIMNAFLGVVAKQRHAFLPWLLEAHLHCGRRDTEVLGRSQDPSRFHSLVEESSHPCGRLLSLATIALRSLTIPARAVYSSMRLVSKVMVESR